MTTKPSKIVISMATAIAWGSGDTIQEKLDGKFALRPWGNSILAGELVRGEFTAFDCVQFEGQDARLQPLAARLAMRGEICRLSGTPQVRTACGPGGEFLRQILDAGGEGAVLKSPGTYFEPMLAAKRLETFVCRVTSRGAGCQSVVVADAATGQPRGSVSLFGGKVDQVRVGSLLKLEAFGLTAVGKLREARPCRDTESSWLVSF